MSRTAALAEPFERFAAVFEMARSSGMPDPNAMILATASADGVPSSRTVLLKDFDTDGFVFYTNFESRKGREILANPRVSLTFFWRSLAEHGGRQVHIRGRAETVTDEEADAYFASRPRGSRIGAWASRQSRPLAGREELLEAVRREEERFEGREVPRPPHWSGFRVVPAEIELWEAGEFRLHDRELYVREGDGWRVTKLYP